MTAEQDLHERGRIADEALSDHKMQRHIRHVDNARLVKAAIEREQQDKALQRAVRRISDG